MSETGGAPAANATTSPIRKTGPLAAAETFRATTALLDIGLPVTDGYELARLLRELSTDPVRFVAITRSAAQPRG